MPKPVVTHKPKNAVKPAQSTEIESTFTAHIMRMVGDLIQANPDRTNSGKYYGEAFIWETLERVAKKKREALWDQMIKDGVVGPISEDPGSYELGMSQRFIASVCVSEPVNRFNADKLCELLERSSYKIPAPIAKDFVAKAKVPTSSTVTKKIIERNVTV
jgi:hypothetical protein